MINILFIIAFIMIGFAFLSIGALLISDRRYRLRTQNIARGTFLHFHYWVGIILGIIGTIVGIVALVMAVLMMIYPLG